LAQAFARTGPLEQRCSCSQQQFSAMPAALDMATVQFSHVHAYCDSLKDLAEYKKLEKKLNEFVKRTDLKKDTFHKGADIAAGRQAWLDLSKEHGDPVTGACSPETWKMQEQDVVEQVMVGLGWRITGMNKNESTTTFAITSPDMSGVKFLVTAHNKLGMQALGGEPAAKRARAEGVQDYFCASKLANFAAERVGRQGFAVLGFTTPAGGVDKIKKRFADLHPKLLLPDMPKQYGGVKVLEVYAYYKGEKCVSDADKGTLIRFVEGADLVDGQWPLPGLQKVDAAYDGITFPAFCDHWVSNVISRTGFLDTLEDTLGFTPKVDFNAGVVAAGEAQIESTVTGNDPNKHISDENMALSDQSQVYLPINNALSEVGHVHLYIKEIGQGIQHIASRVQDLPCVVQRANDYRKMTGAGLNFLSIPRTYYGTLTAGSLSKDASIDLATAEKCLSALKAANIVDKGDIMDLDATREQVAKVLPVSDPKVLEIVMRGRYRNMYSLLRDHLSEETYLRIVRNNILIDVQGDDLLMQIFTSMVLLREAGQEAPFLELIQRICSEKKDPSTGKPKAMKAGCGGFGIRNFLTLFLSIEVSKATKGRAEALEAGKKEVEEYFGKMVDAFTSQLEESNPVLTCISDAMTAEGDALERGDKAAAAKHCAEKGKGQDQLQVVSTKYKNILKGFRENAPAGV